MLSRTLRKPISGVASSINLRPISQSAAVAALAHDIQPAQTSFAQHETALTAKKRGEEFWRRVPIYENVASNDFLSYKWSVSNGQASSSCSNRVLLVAIQIANTVQGKPKLWKFLHAVLPDEVPYDESLLEVQSKEDLIEDIFQGIDAATMAIRVTSVYH